MKQVACLDKEVYDLNQTCLIGEHWLAFEYPRNGKGARSCACGSIKGRQPVGFIRPVERPIYRLPVNINNEPKNYGAGFAPEAVARFLAAGGRLPSWAYVTEIPFQRTKEQQK